MRDITSFSANQVARRLGKGSVIWVNPANITLSAAYLRTRKPKNIGKFLDQWRITHSGMRGGLYNLIYRNQYVIAEDDFNEVEAFEDTSQFKNAADYAAHVDDYRNTHLYSEICASIERHGYYLHKTIRISSLGDIGQFFEDYWGALYKSMHTNGYDASKAPDIGKCYVRSDGQLVKGENARHRLAIARLAGVKRFPLQVFGVSEIWYRNRIGNHLDKQQLLEELKEIENRFQ